MKRIAIIGGGLAGCAAAFILKRNGLYPIIYEAGPHIASGASGNSLGLVNPRISAHKTPESDFFTAAFDMAVGLFDTLPAGETAWNKCGALYVINDEKKEKRFTQTIENWGWAESAMALVDKDRASEIAGIEIKNAALYLSQSGHISPAQLCRYYTKDVEVHFNHSVESLDDIKADGIILACAHGLRKFPQSANFPLQTVRGQITQALATQKSGDLKCILNYDGFCAPARGGAHMIGSTFQRWLEDTDVIAQDDLDNLAALENAFPGFSVDMEIAGSRAALRCSSKDYFPIVGEISENIYVSAAHGSHGIISSLMSAQHISELMLGSKPSLSPSTIKALSPARFL